MKKFRVERHWATIIDAEDYEDAFDKAMLLYAEDYGIEDADLLALRGSLKASVIE